MPSVAFVYDGATTLVATVTGATNGNTVTLEVFGTGNDSAVVSGGGAMLTVTGIAYASGVPFATVIHDDTADVFLAATLFAVGATAPYAHDATWTYDGANTITVTGSWPASPNMALIAIYNGGGVDEFDFASTGAPQTVTLTLSALPVGSYFWAEVVDTTGPSVWYDDRLFTPGVSGAGFPGNPSVVSGLLGRVLIAPNDGPLEPSPTWVRLDDVNNFVAAIDITRGRQTLTSHTDTGTATVLFNDTQGVLDPNNVSSPYFGKITGKQIMLQVWNPVTAAWVPQFRGRIKRRGFDVNPATNPDGSLVVANIQMDCVDVFDYLGGYGLTPGLDGVTPPAGSEGTVWYAETAGTVDDRIIEVVTDVGVDSTMWVVFTGNIRAAEVNYDADEAAITVLRDACDAELPFIANCYVDKLGRFVFHGRESRFDPDTVAAGATPGAWNFTRWKAGDGAAILLDSDRAQIRVLNFNEDEDELINAAICYPKGIAETDIPGQVFADATSIAAHGKHAAPPISDLVIKEGVTTGNSGKVECQKYAELLVKNKKDPRVAIETLGLKAMHPSDACAAKTWALLTGSDISDIVNLKVGYPGGTGIGDPTGEDYYIEGVTMRIRPLVPEYDYVEVELDVSPAEWSMDTHSVFA